jgi:hypothetical protein
MRPVELQLGHHAAFQHCLENIFMSMNKLQGCPVSQGYAFTALNIRKRRWGNTWIFSVDMLLKKQFSNLTPMCHSMSDISSPGHGAGRRYKNCSSRASGAVGTCLWGSGRHQASEYHPIHPEQICQVSLEGLRILLHLALGDLGGAARCNNLRHSTGSEMLRRFNWGYITSHTI